MIDEPRCFAEFRFIKTRFTFLHFADFVMTLTDVKLNRSLYMSSSTLSQYLLNKSITLFIYVGHRINKCVLGSAMSILPHNWENWGLCFHCRLLKNGRSLRGSSMSCSGVEMGLNSFDETPSTLRLSAEVTCRFGFGFCTMTSSIGRFGIPSCLDGTCHDYTVQNIKCKIHTVIQCE